MKMRTRGWLCLLSACLWAAGSAGAVPAKGAAATETELRKFEYEVELETLAFLQQALNPAKVAQEYGLQPPVYPPSLDRDQVRAIIENEVEKIVDKYYPRSRQEEILAYAERRCRLYKPGEEIRLRVLNRLNQWQSRSGTLNRIGSNGVELDGKPIVKINIHEEEYPHLWVEYHERAVAALQDATTARFEASKQDFTVRERRKISRRIWREYGYVKLRGRDEWIPRQEYFERKYRLQWERAYEQVRQTVRTTVLGRHGFRQDEVSGQWIFVGKPPAPEATPDAFGLSDDSLLWKLRQLFQNVNQEDLEIEVEQDIEAVEAPASEDIWGG